MSFYELGLNSDWLQILKLWFQVGVPALGCCTDASGFKVAKTALVFDGTQALIHQEFVLPIILPFFVTLSPHLST